MDEGSDAPFFIRRTAFFNINSQKAWELKALEKAKIRLSDHFTYGKLLRFTLPSVVMMIFTSIYSVVDGYFVSNYVGKTSFASVNFTWPFIMILGSIGFMFGAGGSAVIAKTMGEGKREKSRELFSLFVIVAAICGVVIGVFGWIFIRPLCALLGAEGELLDGCVTYGRILFASMPTFLLQYEFQSFFIAAERPQVGLYVTVASGVTNMVLDALLVAVFPLGLFGAAIATALSQVVGGVIPLIYFALPNGSALRFTAPRFDGRALLRTVTNGSSELMSNISMSIVSMLYNTRLMEYAGEDGVAAYGVLMYVTGIFLAVFIGYATGVAPVVSFSLGAQNNAELRNLFRKSLAVIGRSSLLMFGLGELLASPLASLFVGYDDGLMSLTVHAFKIYSFSFLLSGISVFGSAFFTALGDGLTSALIAFLRSLVFQTAAVMLLPLIFKMDGIWYSIIAAELVSAAVTTVFFAVHRKKYRYF